MSANDMGIMFTLRQIAYGTWQTKNVNHVQILLIHPVMCQTMKSSTGHTRLKGCLCVSPYTTARSTDDYPQIPA